MVVAQNFKLFLLSQIYNHVVVREIRAKGGLHTAEPHLRAGSCPAGVPSAPGVPDRDHIGQFPERGHHIHHDNARSEHIPSELLPRIARDALENDRADQRGAGEDS